MSQLRLLAVTTLVKAYLPRNRGVVGDFLVVFSQCQYLIRRRVSLFCCFVRAHPYSIKEYAALSAFECIDLVVLCTTYFTLCDIYNISYTQVLKSRYEMLLVIILESQET